MNVDHESIETYFDLIRNADDNGRITVVMKGYQNYTGHSMSQLEAMTLDERCQLIYKAVFLPFVISLHQYSPSSNNDGFASLEAELQMNGEEARIEFNLARALGLPGVAPAAELVELRQFFEHWAHLYKLHATLRGGTVRIWSAGSPCSIDWNAGASTLPQSSTEAISKGLASRIAASKALTAWLGHIRQGLCLSGQYSRYNCSAEDILTEDEYLALPNSSPKAEF